MNQSLQTGIVVSVSADGKLELPAELQSQLKPFARYEVFITNNEIVLKKIPISPEWAVLSQRIEEMGEDIDQPSLAEISKIIKEARKVRRIKTE